MLTTYRRLFVVPGILLLTAVSFLLLEGCSARPAAWEKNAGGTDNADPADITGISKTADTEPAEPSDGLSESRMAVPDEGEQPDTAGSVTAVSGETQEDEDPLPVFMTVYVCGEVVYPDVYALTEGSRIYEAIAAAGGFTDEADREWSNLAQEMHDGEMLRIYSRSQTEEMRGRGMTPQSDHFGITASIGQSGTGSDTGYGPDGRNLINLNTASKEQLMTLPGIGESRAEDILAYRAQHGGFTDIRQIQEISGIKQSVFEKIKSYITI